MSLFSYFQRFTAMASTFISDPTFCCFSFFCSTGNVWWMVESRPQAAEPWNDDFNYVAVISCVFSLFKLFFPFFLSFCFLFAAFSLSFASWSVFLRSESEKTRFTLRNESTAYIRWMLLLFFLNYFNRAVYIVEQTHKKGQLDVICYLFF